MEHRQVNQRLGMGLVLLMALFVAGFGLTRAATAEDDSPVAKHMKEINDAYKALRRQARDKKFDDSTRTNLITMQTQTLAAMHEKVPLVEKEPAAKQKTEMVAFKKLLQKQLNQLIDMEIALDQGDNDAVAEGIEALGKIKSEGHDRFTED
ncbi:MAG: hypothetical protein GC162_10765 [Planctomycetes bacterium]|nr:hypothetical protein [Planctomycetota bacterium]